MFGAAWYFAPQRWATTDGFAPYAVVLHAYAATHAERALDRLTVARAVSLAFAKEDERQRAWQQDRRASEGR